MEDQLIELFLISLNIITFTILAYVLLSKHKFKITLVGFWQNILLLIVMLLASKLVKFFGYETFAETVFLVFSAMVMLIMLVSFAMHYPAYEENFEGK